jgi:hypothetical protein
MNPLPDVSYIDIQVPNTKTEQEFLRLAVQAAVMEYRKAHGNSINPPQAAYDKVFFLPESSY